MNRKNLEISFYTALGTYLYEVILNLYAKMRFVNALVHVDWIRIFVVAIVCGSSMTYTEIKFFDMKLVSLANGN